MLVFGSGAYNDVESQEFFSILDMSSLEWTNSFDPDAEPYAVPPAISSAIGGDSSGGATKLQPIQLVGPWQDSLQDLSFKTPWGPANLTSKITRQNGDPDSTSTSDGASNDTSGLTIVQIAGIVIGAVVAFVLVMVGIGFFHRHRGQSQRVSPKPSSAPDTPPETYRTSELPVEAPM